MGNVEHKRYMYWVPSHVESPICKRHREINLWIGGKEIYEKKWTKLMKRGWKNYENRLK